MRKLILFFIFFLITITISAQTNSILYGKALDENGKPISNVKVEIIYIPWNKIYETTTDKNGKFTIGNLKVGDAYSVKYIHEDYLSVTKEEVYMNIGINNLTLYMQHKQLQICESLK